VEICRLSNARVVSERERSRRLRLLVGRRCQSASPGARISELSRLGTNRRACRARRACFGDSAEMLGLPGVGSPKSRGGTPGGRPCGPVSEITRGSRGELCGAGGSSSRPPPDRRTATSDHIATGGGHDEREVESGRDRGGPNRGANTAVPVDSLPIANLCCSGRRSRSDRPQCRDAHSRSVGVNQNPHIAVTSQV
jgi:hypothetical protein